MGYTGAIRLSRAVVLLHRLGTLLGPELVARQDVFDALVAGCNSEGSSSSSCQIEYTLPRALVSLVSATRDETQASAGAGGGGGGGATSLVGDSVRVEYILAEGGCGGGGDRYHCGAGIDQPIGGAGGYAVPDMWVGFERVFLDEEDDDASAGGGCSSSRWRGIA